jgi:putative SOS response-associated peptidase YedK
MVKKAGNSAPAFLYLRIVPSHTKRNQTRLATSFKEIHDRMPVILDPVDDEAWLNPENSDAGYLLAQFDASRMTVRPVSSYVNNARNQGPECVASA